MKTLNDIVVLFYILFCLGTFPHSRCKDTTNFWNIQIYCRLEIADWRLKNLLPTFPPRFAGKGNTSKRQNVSLWRKKCKKNHFSVFPLFLYLHPPSGAWGLPLHSTHYTLHSFRLQKYDYFL